MTISIPFDANWYLSQNPDVAAAVQAGLISAQGHAEQFGIAEGRLLTPVFDADFYVRQNPDVARAIAEGQLESAAQHFILAGHREGRAINPALDLAKYVAANADLAGPTAAGTISTLGHLLQYGLAEGRSLGNGITLTAFSNDPGFTQAVGGNHYMEARVRVATVAPYVPTFQRPGGWAPPADAPIPVDFRAPADSGLKLIVPPEVKVPEGVALSDRVFQLDGRPTPVPTPIPTPGGGGGGGGDGGGPDVPTFTVETDQNGILTVPSSNGNVTVAENGNNYVLTPANGNSVTIPKDDTKGIAVANGVSLVAPGSVLKNIIDAADPASTAITGAVTISDTVSVTNANAIASKIDGVVTATLAPGNLTDFNAIETGNAYTITLNDAAGTNMTAAALSALGGGTSGPVTINNAVVIGGTADEVAAALVNPDTRVLAPNSAVNINTTANTDVSAATLRAVGGATSGTVTVSNAVNITGTAADVKAALLDADTKVIADSARVAISDAISVTDAQAIAATTTGVVTATLLPGTLASFSGIEFGNAYTITVNEVAGTPMLATELTMVGGRTTGPVTLNNAVVISGTTDEVTAALVTEATRVVAPTAEVTITDTAANTLAAPLSASALAAIGAATTGAVTVGNAVTISGTATDVTAALITENSRVIAPMALVTITDTAETTTLDGGTPLTASALSAIGGATTGTVTVGNAVTISGTAAELTAALVTEATKVIASTAHVIVNGAVDASALTAIHNATTGTVTLLGTSDADTYIFENFSAGPLNIGGRGGNDTIIAGNGNDTVDGGDGNDDIDGGAGNDTINGGDDADTINGGAGNDTINGGTGNDTITGGTGNDTINGGTGNDTINGGIGDDILNGDAGNDTLYGDEGADTLNGGDGDDHIYGGSGTDTIHGGSGSDSLYGGDGNDHLIGGTGVDYLHGESGNDRFDFVGISSAADRNIVTDFRSGDQVLLDPTVTAASTGAGSRPNFIEYDVSGGRRGNNPWDYRIDQNGDIQNIDLIEFTNLNTSGGSLSGDIDGQRLLAMLPGDGEAIRNLDSGNDSIGINLYLLAYDDGNAYLYLVGSGRYAGEHTGQIKLIGEFEGVARQSLQLLYKI